MAHTYCFLIYWKAIRTNMLIRNVIHQIIIIATEQCLQNRKYPFMQDGVSYCNFEIKKTKLFKQKVSMDTVWTKLQMNFAKKNILHFFSALSAKLLTWIRNQRMGSKKKFHWMKYNSTQCIAKRWENNRNGYQHIKWII